jgi:hypothetical protein
VEDVKEVKERAEDKKPVNKVKQAPKVVEVAVEDKVHFDEWFASRKNSIPPHHRREIILADFKARKVPVEAEPSVFDAALGMYGVKLV